MAKFLFHIFLIEWTRQIRSKCPSCGTPCNDWWLISLRWPSQYHNYSSNFSQVSKNNCVWCFCFCFCLSCLKIWWEKKIQGAIWGLNIFGWFEILFWCESIGSAIVMSQTSPLTLFNTEALKCSSKGFVTPPRSVGDYLWLTHIFSKSADFWPRNNRSNQWI